MKTGQVQVHRQMHVTSTIPKLKLNLVRLMESTNVTLTQEKIPDIQRLRIQGIARINTEKFEQF